jgi:WD40 repeat protein
MGSVIDALTGELLYQHHSPLNCGASFERHGMPHVVIGTYTGEGIVFSIAYDGKVSHVSMLPLHTNAVKAVAASNGKIFSVCADTGASWFSIDDFREIARLDKAHDRIANGCAALPGGRFVSVSRDHTLRLWDNNQAIAIKTPHNRSIKCVSTSHCGRYIASGSYFGVVALYDTEHATWMQSVRPTTAGISSLCFDVGNNCFLAGSYDGKVYEIHTGEA